MDQGLAASKINRLDQALLRLKSSGLRSTEFRKNLVELLIEEAPKAMTVEAIHAHPKTCAADLVTVYRNVDALTRIELLKRLSDESGASLYKLNDYDQLTLSITCRSCHSVHESPLAMGDQVESVAKAIGFTHLRSRCEVVGYCEECTNTQAGSQK